MSDIASGMSESGENILQNSGKLNWYVLHVVSGREDKIVSLIKKKSPENLAPFIPQKKLKIRKGGAIRESVAPFYPGYIFLIGKWNIDEAKPILEIRNVINIVGGIKTPGCLTDDEKTLLKKIAKDGLVEYSKVIKEGSKIKVISGPLKEIEGFIVSVDRRKNRATVSLPLLNSFVKVTLGFEYLEEDNEKS